MGKATLRVCNIRGSLYNIREDGAIISHKDKLITTWTENSSGYLLFRARYEDGSSKCYRLHRILGECFIPNPENLPFVKHKNDDKTDNSLPNLEWGANPDNVKEGYDNCCYRSKRRSYKIKVTNLLTNEVLQFKSLRRMSEVLPVNRKNVAAILEGKKSNTYNYSFKYEEV